MTRVQLIQERDRIGDASAVLVDDHAAIRVPVRDLATCAMDCVMQDAPPDAGQSFDVPAKLILRAQGH